MKIATILPTENLGIEARSDYHMCLAHLMNIAEYRKFFEWQVARGAHVIMDNGVVETGQALPIIRLLEIAADVGVTEMTLPDRINDRRVTLHMHKNALELIEMCGDLSSQSSQLRYSHQKVMVIPQGCDQEDWIASVVDMLKLAEEHPNIVAVGISKFCVGEKLFKSRLDALNSVPGLLESPLDIHLLGCPDHPSEIRYIAKELNERVRGVDSGLPVFYTLHRQVMTTTSVRPVGLELDFDVKFDCNEENLLVRNVRMWKRLITWMGLQ